MLMVSVDAAEVERQLCAGELACPDCEGELRPWGATPRRVRCRDGRIERGARRSRCAGCATTHVLLPVSALRRRLDQAETIVVALLAHARGLGHRKVAAGLGRPDDTVRGWLRRARQRAPEIREQFTRLGHERFGCDLRRTPLADALADALDVIGVVVRAAVQQLGPTPMWHVVAGGSAGELLCNTSRLFPPALARPQADASTVTTTTVLAIATAEREGDAADERSPP